MTTCAPAIEPAVGMEPIPGYVLTQRLASGGFGEVWRAAAPGGLEKAVKFVYGSLDESLATQELQSLNRIKEVHHPFLLSLERIEVVAGRLLIVSELADGCLLDRFQACRDAGLPGIPRDELLDYLQDAADVLDYLYEKYSLQHLDVKPQNLLLVGNHVKVADFGLLRNIQDGQQAKMGGISPTYAPPEIYSGKPSRHSDQYSLAVVFQEMLTGELPFQGRNTAQLAAQHLYSAPKLAGLPPADRPVVSRSLAKTPDARFPNCRTLIKSLRAPDVTAAERTPAVLTLTSQPVATEKTVVLGGIHLGATDKPTIGMLVEQVEVVRRDLDPVELPREPVGFCPTLFVGVGGVGIQILSQLRGRLTESLTQPLAHVPAFQMLILDTDSKSLATAISTGTPCAFPGRETLATPLRPSADYRPDSQKFLPWLGRKWLYNVPRSLQTEGIRPYGRLALVDHYPAIATRLRKLIAETFSPAAADASTAATGRDFDRRAGRIFLIAATAGGTGSGMVLDLAFAIRSLLAEQQLAHVELQGVLLHGHARHVGNRELSIANTCACLSELGYYCQEGGAYPGDASCPIAPAELSQGAFDHTYFVDLGEELGDGESAIATDQVAQYLLLNTLPPAKGFFDVARRTEPPATANSLRRRRVRSFGLSRQPADSSPHHSNQDRLLAESLFRYWIQPRNASTGRDDPHASSAAMELLLELGLSLDQLVDASERIFAAREQHTPLQFAERAMAAARQADLDRSPEAVLHAFDASLSAIGGPTGNSDPPTSLITRLTAAVREVASTQGPAIRDWVVQFVQRPGPRLHSAQVAAMAVAAELEKTYVQSRTRVESLEQEAMHLQVAIRQLTGLSGRPREEVEPELHRYAALRIRQVICRAVQAAAAGLIRSVHAAVQRLETFHMTVRHLLRQVDPAAPVDTSAPIGPPSVTVSLPLLQQVDEQLDRLLQDAGQPLVKFLETPASAEKLLALVTRAVRSAQGTTQSSAGDAELARIPKSLGEQLQQANPRTFQFGGERRLLVAVPPDLHPDAVQRILSDQLGQPATVITQPADEVAVCYEVEQVPLDNILADLLARFPGCLEAVRRVHTRTDVHWTL